MKFTDLLKEAVYDIVGYVLPGLITIPFLFLLIQGGFHYSSLYSIYYNLDNLKLLLLPFNSPLTYLVPLFIISYIIGIFLKYLGILVGKIFELLLGKNFAYNNFFCFFRVKEDSNAPADIISILKDSSKTIVDKYDGFSSSTTNATTSDNSSNTNGAYNNANGNLSSAENFSNLFNDSSFLKEYARTISRFNNHNNLTQKYIAKTNFFSSLSTLFLLEFINAFISLIVYGFNLHTASQLSLINVLFPFTTSVIFFLLFIFCFIEFIDHKNYQNKENFFFLLENYYRKDAIISTETTSASTSTEAGN